ncbi:RNA polymerase sigma factor [Bordetella sp. N]|uniref:RNA polymerase sigma factor n=1 Tax=Bordetella sp. N TaxID=1746199 RepID=UPI0018D22C27|nr:RNA polymerase sigma factor [Bordetella sp. N]
MSALLAALVEQYDVLKNHLRRRFGDQEMIADVMQDLCVKVLERQDKAAPTATPLNLLKHMGRHLAIDHYRADVARGAVMVAVDDVPEAATELAGPECAAMSGQTAAALLATIQALPERCREAFILVRLHDIPQAEAARILGITRGMVARHVARALEEIQPILDIHSGPHET